MGEFLNLKDNQWVIRAGQLVRWLMGLLIMAVGILFRQETHAWVTFAFGLLLFITGFLKALMLWKNTWFWH